jgi:tetratricopeptide (TPR) repeat protein
MEPSSATYGVREVAQLLGVPVARVRSLARAGLVEVQRGARGELRFGFRELAFLRQLRDLRGDRKSVRRAHRALERLRATLPPERDLCELGLATAAGELVVRESGRLWSPESGQFVFDFERAPESEPAALVRALASAEPVCDRDADGWYRLGCELEPANPEQARAAYARALALAPAHPDAHLNLGCLDHEAGRLPDAEAHYRAALAARSGDATARFDLAVVLEDQRRMDEARDAYLACLADDPAYADAHYNLARVCERAGDLTTALRHLIAYRRLVTESSGS